MKLWTIQPMEWYDKLLSDGIIYGEEHLIDFIKDDDFQNAYHWMIKKMEEKIGNRPFKNAYPIWAWHQYSNINKRKPDLRNKGFLTKGTKGMRIEFEKYVLLSDFALWTHPINFWYIADNENDDNNFDSDICSVINLLSSFWGLSKNDIEREISNIFNKILKQIK